MPLPEHVSPKSDSRNSHSSPVDAVYLWVSDKDPGFDQNLSSASGITDDAYPPQSSGTYRFRDNGELRYSLRSLAEHAPWIRRIFIVTNGQKPDWLDTENARITLVNHKEIFPDADCLPTFNSNAIELQLHRIEGLSTHFIYLNDDVFFGHKIEREHFIDSSGTKIIYCDNIPVPDNQTADNAHDKAIVHTLNVIKNREAFSTPSFLPAHTPQLYNRKTLEKIENELRNDQRIASQNRLRSEADLVLRVLYSSYVANLKNHRLVTIVSGSPSYSFVRLRPQSQNVPHELAYILRSKPKFFCINDEIEDMLTSEKYFRVFRQFLRQYFPNPSEFEFSSA